MADFQAPRTIEQIDEVNLADSGFLIRRVVQGWDAQFYIGLVLVFVGLALADGLALLVGMVVASTATYMFARYSRVAWLAFGPSALVSIATVAATLSEHTDVLAIRGSDPFSQIRHGQVPSAGGAAVFALIFAVGLSYPTLRGIFAVPKLLARRLPTQGLRLSTVIEAADRYRSASLRKMMDGASCPACAVVTMFVAFAVIVTLLVIQVSLIGDALSNTRFWGFPIFITVFAGTVFSMLIRRFLQPEALELMKLDRRAPVVLLRSFSDDAITMPAKGALMANLRFSTHVDYSGADIPDHWQFGFYHLLDEALSDELSYFGPYISIGQPSNMAPTLGSAKSYFADDTWYRAVSSWIQQAQIIVLVAGRSEGVRRELRAIVERRRLDRLIIVLAPNTFEHRMERWRQLQRDLADTPWAATLAKVRIADARAVSLLPGGRVWVVRSEEDHTIDYEIALRLSASHVMIRHAPEMRHK